VDEAADPTPHEPPEERLAARLETSPTTPARSTVARAVRERAAVDKAVYRAIAQTPTLDEPLRRLSNLTNNSKLWFGVAGLLFVVGGRAGRRAALTGAVAIGVNSAVVNLPVKYAARRVRPDRAAVGVPVRGLAATVAYSRVHTGVHYPGDVIVGSLIGASIGEATALVEGSMRRRRSASVIPVDPG